jgi:UDP:flavonoid glycosyltransferase YjiC (YdhE family)
LSTITKVLAAGLPMVGLPVLGDQPANAARIVAAGAGLRLPKEASATTIGEAVRRILDDSRFRRSAGRFAAVLANQNPADLIVTELENLLGRTTMTLE